MGWGDLLARDRRGFAPISIGQDGCLEIPLTEVRKPKTCYALKEAVIPDGRDHITGNPLGEQHPIYKGVCQRDYLEIFVVRNLANFGVRGLHEDTVKN